jgi:DNA-binding NtrC family response regulator
MQPQDDKRTVRILLLEDDRCDVELFRFALVKRAVQCDLTTVATQKGFEQALASGALDLVISDSGILGFSGLAALDLVRSRFPRMPFILMSGILPERVRIEAMKRGATDCFSKDDLSKVISVIERLSG